MRGIVLTGAGGTEVLALRDDLPQPQPGPGDALVRVAAAGVNRADVLERQGRYTAPQSDGPPIPGLEFAGTVEALGPGVSEVAIGERVFAITASGAYAEYVSVNAGTLAKLPARFSFAEAAAVPEAFITAYDALFTSGGFDAGQTVLVHSAGSSVALAAFGLAKAAGGGTLGTSRTQEKLERAAGLGCDRGILLSDEFSKDVLGATGGAGVHVVLDFLGAPALAQNLRSLKLKGRIVHIGTLAGIRGNFEIGLLMAKRASLIGTVLRSRPLEEKIAVAEAFRNHVLPLLEDGRVAPVVDSTFPLSEVARAHERMEANENFGKIVLTL